jgi:hypothetical protein
MVVYSCAVPSRILERGCLAARTPLGNKCAFLVALPMGEKPKSRHFRHCHLRFYSHDDDDDDDDDIL